jgi:hypothetical protein
MDGGIRTTHNLAEKERKEVWGKEKEGTRMIGIAEENREEL